MPKSYPTLTTFVAGNVLTAAEMNDVKTNLDNFRVPALLRIRRAAAQSIANNVIGVVRFDTEDEDTDGMFTATSNIVTVQTAGIYLVSANVLFAAGTGPRAAGIYLNPTFSGSGDGATINTGTRIAQMPISTTAAGVPQACNPSTIYEFAQNDTIAVSAYQNSGGALNTDNADGCTLNIAWLGKTS